MLVAADERTPGIMGRGSVLLGQAFSRDGERLKSLEDQSERSIDAVAEPSNCWGNFALFVAEGREARAYRDPSGSVPVYQLSSANGDLFLSDAEVASALGFLDKAPVDPAFAVHWLQFPYLRSSRTGLENVRELLPGTMGRRMNGQWREELSWDPWAHARAKNLPNLRTAAEAVRGAALDCIAKQVSDSPVLLQLSGGLDSSIVAACFHQADIPFRAVTFATRSADGDERRYARAVAKACNVELKEIFEEELESELIRTVERTFRPGSNPILIPLDRAVESHRREVGAQLLVDGGGGDNLFCHLTSAAPALDALRGSGPWTALQTANDIARRADCTLWEVAGAALRRAWPTSRRWKEDRTFLASDALLHRPDPHLWLQTRPFGPPGKRDHVESLVQIQHFLDRRLTAGTAALHPLMAQPLLETCLAVPTWLWVGGGIDRAVAREAFKPLLPAAIVGRRSKGSLEGLFHRSFARLHADFKDLLLGGELRRLGILDTVSVERAFATDLWASDETLMRLSEMVALDHWLQSWRGQVDKDHAVEG